MHENRVMRYSITSSRWAAAALAFCAAGLVQADVLDSTIQTETGSNSGSRAAQQRIDTLSERADDLIDQYRSVVNETNSLKVYNESLERVVESQRAEMLAINAQLETLEDTNRGVVPLMVEMIDMLDKIVVADTPFLINQRKKLVTDLRSDIYRADVTTSEKYRRVMEAYQREVDFGRNAAAYEAKLPGTDRTVTFLKVGRTLLIYQSQDEEEIGWWNPSTQTFEPLGGEYASSIKNAIRIAKNQEAPNLVKLPVPAPVAAGAGK